MKLALALACVMTAACSFPRSRDCFPQRTGLATETPPAPALANPPASVADIVELVAVARDLAEPVALAQPRGERERLFIAERGGRIVMLRPGSEPVVVADLSDRVDATNSAGGLLGIAFHPAFPKKKRLYVDYTGRDGGATHVVELAMDRGYPDAVDRAGEREILRIGQPWPENHGGNLVFGRDGLLYIGTGDGGGKNDPNGNAQRCDSWRGKLLRVDVDARELAVEIVEMGLRDPWRYSFDGKTGDLYIGDRGAESRQLLFAVPDRELLGHNFGWNIATGSRCAGNRPCDRSGFTVPILEYDRDSGCAIVGGHVYRGASLPELDGIYFFGDYCTGMLRSVRWKDGHLSEHWDWKPVLDRQGAIRRVLSFGTDQAGELYVLASSGTLWKLQRKGGP